MSDQKTPPEPAPAAPSATPDAPASAAPPSPQPRTPAPPPAKPAAPAATAPASAPARPPAPPAKGEVSSPTPLQMMTPQLKTFLEQKLRSGEQVTIEVGKDSFTGRIFRTMVHEGWIALEHVDGRRRPFMIIEGGRLSDRSGTVVQLPGGHAK